MKPTTPRIRLQIDRIVSDRPLDRTALESALRQQLMQHGTGEHSHSLYRAKVSGAQSPGRTSGQTSGVAAIAQAVRKAISR